jgi:hypothetical protein
VIWLHWLRWNYADRSALKNEAPRIGLDRQAIGSNVFPLTAELVNYEEWNEENILRRHDKLNRLARDIRNL